MAKKDNLSGDISELPPKQYWEVHWFSKGDVVRAYGAQPLSQASDADQAAAAFRQQADPIEPGGAIPPQEPSAPIGQTGGALNLTRYAGLASRSL